MRKLITKPFEIALLFLFIAGAVTLNSCGGDDPEAAPAPTAAFDYESDGLIVTFTNKSTNAKTYAWDFGDGTTSVDAAPEHTYEKYGKYTVKLTATGDGGSDAADPDEITLAKSSPIVLDDSFADWSTIATASTSVDGNGGSIDIMKVDYNAEKIFVYLEGDLKGVFGLFINSDDDAETGATTPNFDYLWANLGADYYIEGNYADWGTFFEKDPSDPDWVWIDLGASSAVITSSPLGDKGEKKAIEFSILRSAIPNMSSSKVSIAIKDIDIDNGWITAGGLPPMTQAEVPGAAFVLDLTK